jgi:hypothetical protein
MGGGVSYIYFSPARIDPSLSQEIEKLVSHLNDEQLDQLESILAKDLDTDSEFNMLLEGVIFKNSAESVSP